MEIPEKLKEIETQQLSSRKSTGEYTQDYRIVKDGLDYEVHEYSNPRYGYWGYQVIFHETRGNDKYITSFGYGNECKERSYNWLKINR